VQGDFGGPPLFCSILSRPSCGLWDTTGQEYRKPV